MTLSSVDSIALDPRLEWDNSGQFRSAPRIEWKLRVLAAMNGLMHPIGFLFSPTSTLKRLASETVHIPVLLTEVMEQSGVPSAKGTGWIWIDGTLGGAGHACSMIEKLGTGDLFVGMDRDPTALERSIERIERSGAEG
ncbi:MAG: 16S rRNA (cytosine(1402)-N(4))-methyltransferase, partial [Planctomycetes bacterium]|nr:16S rRNA (cytosine(1402)-N(4))-methyltransferase [Planctomycetota bacterium]